MKVFQGNKKKCFVPECQEQIPIKLLMCPAHWAQVPEDLQNAVHRTPLQWSRGASPRAYMEAIEKAAAAVQQKGKR